MLLLGAGDEGGGLPAPHPLHGGGGAGTYILCNMLLLGAGDEGGGLPAPHPLHGGGGAGPPVRVVAVARASQLPPLVVVVVVAASNIWTNSFLLLPY